MINNKYKQKIGALLIFILMAVFYSVSVLSVPTAPTISYIKNETTPFAGIGTNRTSDQGGYITTINFDAKQQNYGWKAYVGNVTGSLVLENALNYSIYEWPLSSNAQQEVYISRNASIVWASVNCSNSSLIAAEDTFMGLNSTTSNSINRTFNTTTHKTFAVGGTTITNSTCPATATYLSDAAQAVSESAKFQEILLKDSLSNFIYATIIDQNQAGFDTNVYDFQAIIAENEDAITPTTYFFYVELN